MSVAVCMHGKTGRRRGIPELSEAAYAKDIVHPLERYDEKMTPLSRGYVPPGGWQQEFLDTLVPAIGQQGAVPRDEPGYTQIDLALRIAGFHIAMATNCHTGNWTRPRLSDELRESVAPAGVLPSCSCSSLTVAALIGYPLRRLGAGCPILGRVMNAAMSFLLASPKDGARAPVSR